MRHLRLTINPELASEPNLAQGSSLTRTIWGINWNQYFPLQLDGGITVEVSNFKAVSEFSKANFFRIYGEDAAKSPFLLFDMSEERRRYFEHAGDFFIFKDEGRPVGMFVGTALDWSTYYLRNASILPEYQGRKLYQKFLDVFITALKESGVERADGDVAPTNLGHIHVLTKMSFQIVGTTLSERWGAMVHFTKFLSPKHEAVFQKQFCWSHITHKKLSNTG